MMPLQRKSIPLLLTWARIGAIPLFLLAANLPSTAGKWSAIGIFLAAACTDWLDGALARRWHATSSTGRFLDPVADKLLVATALVLLVARDAAPMLPVLLVIGRELWVSGLRECLSERHIVVHVSPLAKWKTAVQMLSIPLLLAAQGDGTPLLTAAGIAAIWIAAGLAVVTGYGYTRAAWGYFGPDTPKDLP